MSQRVDIIRSLFGWAIERSGKGYDEIALAFPKLGEWQSGAAAPTYNQLRAFARKTWTPLGYFYLPHPPKEPLPVPDFRTKGSAGVRRASANLLETLHSIRRRQSWLREYLLETGSPKLAFIGSAKPSEPVIKVAAAMRRLLGIPHGWAGQASSWREALQVLRDAAQSKGVYVVINGVVGNDTHRALDPTEFRGFVLSDPYAPFVFINGADAQSAQIFTLAHELAHLWVGEPALFDLPKLRVEGNAIEASCNRVAAEFLVPAAEFEPLWSQVGGAANSFELLARRFKVSPLVVALRALALGKISSEAFDALLLAFQTQERKKSARKPGGDFYNNQNVRVGKSFARIVMLAAKAGQLQYSEAYKLTGLFGATFDKYAKRLGLSL